MVNAEIKDNHEKSQQMQENNSGFRAGMRKKLA